MKTTDEKGIVALEQEDFFPIPKEGPPNKTAKLEARIDELQEIIRDLEQKQDERFELIREALNILLVEGRSHLRFEHKDQHIVPRLTRKFLY